MAILVVGSVLFYLLAKMGARLLDDVERQEKAAIEQAGDEKLEQGVAPSFLGLTAVTPDAGVAVGQ